MKRKYWIIGIILVVLVAGYFVYRSLIQKNAAQAAASSVETAKVEKGTLTITIDATGKVRSAQNAVLNWGTSGTVEKVNVQTGQTVKAGDVLATLAQNSLPQTVITAHADLQSAQQALDDLYTQAETNKTTAMKNISTYAQDVRDAQYQLDNFTVPTDQAGMSAMEALAATEKKLNEARAAFEPYKFDPFESKTRQDLKKQLDIAQASYDAAVKRVEYEYELEVAKANLAQAQKDYEKYKDGPSDSDVAAAKAKITAAEATLRLAWIEAPFDGTVTEVIPQPGDQVTANQEAFRVDNLTTLYIDLSVSEVDIPNIKKGLPVTITFDAIRGKTYKGEVSEVSMVSDTSSSTANYAVTVKMDESSSEVLPGMTSAVEIMIQQQDQTLLVPNQAIRYENGQQVVYVVGPTGTRVIPVQIGISSDTYTQVVSEQLKEGDLVVVNTASSSSNGQGMPPGMFMGPRESNSRTSSSNNSNAGGQP